jgi:hypothetical protein
MDVETGKVMQKLEGACSHLQGALQLHSEVCPHFCRPLDASSLGLLLT